jgi:hypothetical protein
MSITHHIIRASAACAIAGVLAAPALGRAQDDPVSPQQAVASQDLRSPDARDASTTSSLAGTTTAGTPAHDLRSPDTRDAADGRGTFNTPDVTVVKLPQPPAPVHADHGVDWTDAGIGAAILLAVLAVAFGAAMAIGRRRRHRPRAAVAA